MLLQTCECGATMLWRWGYISWRFDCLVCGREVEVPLPEAEDRKWK